MMSTKRSRVLKWQVIIFTGLLFVVAGLLYSGDAPADDWKAPARAARKENPVPADAEAIAAGQKIFVANCLACHGAAGKGDGPAAAACKPRPKDLADPKISSQTDGELFWKITQGKPPMPTYEKLLSETDRWRVIDYFRTLAPASSAPPATQPAKGQ
jgi:mono/diheme cytochrome c family protein